MGRYYPILQAAAEGNFTKAGQKLGYSQSNLSHIVRNLETEFQIRLFDRERHGVKLTNAGREMAEVMEEIEALENRLWKIAQSHRMDCLSVGTFYSASAYLVPHILERFTRVCPETRVTVLEKESYWDLEESLRGGEVDCTFYAGRSYSSGFTFTPLLRDPYFVVTPRDHPLAARSSAALGELERYPFLMPSEGLDNGILSGPLSRLTLRSKVEVKYQEDHATLNLVEHGFGITLLPGLIARNTLRPVAAVPLEEGLARTVGILYRGPEPAPGALSRFIRTAQRYLREMEYKV